MIAVTASRIEGYHITVYKGTAQGEIFEKLLKSAKLLGADGILNTCYDDALDVDTLFHGAAVVIEPIPAPAIRPRPADTLSQPRQQMPEAQLSSLEPSPDH